MKEKGTVQKDRQVQDYLSKRYSGESRRSFFSKLSRVVFGMAGFHLASRLAVVAGPPMFQGTKLYCGIFGVSLWDRELSEVRRFRRRQLESLLLRFCRFLLEVLYLYRLLQNHGIYGKWLCFNDVGVHVPL